MLIIGSKSGQLANRLFIFSHFIANAIEYKYTLINLKFYEYTSFFEATSKNHFNGYPIYVQFQFVNNLRLNAYITTGIKHLVQLLNKKDNSLIHSKYCIFDTHDNKNREFDLNNAAYLSDVRNKIVIAHGWTFRDNINFIKYASLIRSFFQPIQQHRENINKLTSKCRKNNAVLIGVHIRKGDYKEFMGGKYYFNTSIYAHKLNQLEKLFLARGRQVVFLICSNEKIENQWFNDLEYYVGTGHPVEDLYALAACDYLIGVPSTYTMWASFYGQVPLCTIYHEDEIINIEDFKI